MARPKLYRSDQPFWLRSVLRLYEFFGSLKLAVVVIFFVASVLAFATFVESNLGTAAVKWYVYHTKSFAALLTLLAINIFCAASIRFPWKRHQTGFVVTHIGLLTMLAGSAISFRGSVNSQLLVFKDGKPSQTAIDQDEAAIVLTGLPGRAAPLRFNFRPGPFNWPDLEPTHWKKTLLSLVGQYDSSKSWEHPPQLVYEHDGTKVEVVDFFSRSEVHRVPYMALDFKQSVIGAELPIELEFNQELQFAQADFQGFGTVMMWQTDSETGLQAFTECAPQRTVVDDGAVVIWFKGETHHLNISRLLKLKEQNQPSELSDGLKVELVDYAPWADISGLLRGGGLISRGIEPRMPAVELKLTEIVDGEDRTYRVVRFAQFPFTPNKSAPDEFLAEFYHPSVKGRVDILEWPNQDDPEQNRLAFRVWQQKQGRIVAAGDLKTNEPVSTWSMGGGKAVWEMTLKQYVPKTSDDETIRVLPMAFDKGDRGATKRVNVRVSWTDAKTKKRQQDEFWLRQSLPPPWASQVNAQIHETNVADGEPIRTVYNVKETPVGFALVLVEFDLDVDPGTRMAGNYTSHIVKIDLRNEPEVKQLREQIRKTSDRDEKQQFREQLSDLVATRVAKFSNELKGLDEQERSKLVESNAALDERIVTMNRPLDYPDWYGRTLRFFQENYLPPDDQQKTAVGSIFRVNYDPGRPIKYLGSLLITIGIYLMFYMRAYFITSIRKPPILGGAKNTAADNENASAEEKPSESANVPKTSTIA